MCTEPIPAKVGSVLINNLPIVESDKKNNKHIITDDHQKKKK